MGENKRKHCFWRAFSPTPLFAGRSLKHRCTTGMLRCKKHTFIIISTKFCFNTKLRWQRGLRSSADDQARASRAAAKEPCPAQQHREQPKSTRSSSRSFEQRADCEQQRRGEEGVEEGPLRSLPSSLRSRRGYRCLFLESLIQGWSKDRALLGPSASCG